MFGIGSTELLLILVVALIVLGPESLPKIARTIGKALGEFRKVSTEFQRTLNTEIALDEHEKRKKEAEDELFPDDKDGKKSEPVDNAESKEADTEVKPSAENSEDNTAENIVEKSAEKSEGKAV